MVLIFFLLLQESKAARREVLAGLFAASAVLASAPAQAFSGPGGDGAERTAQKADELLKGADSLTNNDSPTRFGPGRVEDAANEAGSVAAKSALPPNVCCNVIALDEQGA